MDSNQLFEKAHNEFLRKNFDEAIYILKNITKNKNDYNLQDVNDLISNCFYLKNEYKNSIKFAERAISEKPISHKSATAYFRIWNCYKKMGDFENEDKVSMQLIDTLHKIWEGDFDETEKNLALMNLGTCYRLRSDFQNALNYLSKFYNLIINKDYEFSLLKGGLSAIFHELNLIFTELEKNPQIVEIELKKKF